MRCNACNHTLPEDSLFCQYCGAIIKNNKSNSKTEEADTHDSTSKANTSPATPTSDQETKSFIDSTASAIAGIVQRNVTDQKDSNDIDFGLVPEKPIYTPFSRLVDGENEYLNSLLTIDGEKITWDRRGSTNAEGIHGIIDIYNTFLPSGKPYKTLFINMYGANFSKKAPAGFIFSQNKRKKNNKKAFCRKCGHEITGKRCEYCHPKKTKKQKKFLPITVLYSVIALLLIGNIVQGCFHYANHKKIINLNQTVLIQKSDLSEKDNNIEKLNKNINELKTKVEDYKEKADYFTRIKFNSLVINKSIGYASESFHTNKGIIIMDKDSNPQQITLFADFNTHVTIDTETNGDSAKISFDESTWYGSSTTLTVTPKKTGFTSVTFSNSLNRQEFFVIIIVE